MKPMKLSRCYVQPPRAHFSVGAEGKTVTFIAVYERDGSSFCTYCNLSRGSERPSGKTVWTSPLKFRGLGRVRCFVVTFSSDEVWFLQNYIVPPPSFYKTSRRHNDDTTNTTRTQVQPQTPTINGNPSLRIREKHAKNTNKSLNQRAKKNGSSPLSIKPAASRDPHKSHGGLVRPGHVHNFSDSSLLQKCPKNRRVGLPSR